MTGRIAVASLALVVFLTSMEEANADDDGLTLPSGEYVVTAIRRNGMVLSTADAEPNTGDLIGSKARFGEILEWIDGTSCGDWNGMASRNETLNLHDPLLSDLAIEKLDPPAYDVFAFAQTMDLFCDRSNLAPIANITVIDDRVLLTGSPGGSYHIILEKPLSQEEVRRLQTQLNDMKFYEGEATGNMDEATRGAIAAYAEYRGAEYRFQNTVVTRNLLDGLDVLEE